MRYSSSTLLNFFITITFSLLLALPAAAQNSVPKLVYLITDDDKLIASNIKFNRFDELRLKAREQLLDQAVADAVIIIVTNKRIIGYSVYAAGWKELDLKAEEQVRGITAEDYSALIQTNKRFISFNGETGEWAETRRSKVFD